MLAMVDAMEKANGFLKLQFRFSIHTQYNTTCAVFLQPWETIHPILPTAPSAPS
ncbi:hypothetical protein FACS189472_18970 [Alphaproteobacteria bacterium]|nr:hypothetical protein FACS189472_18970 [Alphaproteobacteria bacterium]